MKRILVTTLFLMSSLASANEGKFYVGPEVGISMSTKAGSDYANKKLGHPVSFGLFAGYELDSNAAIELNLSRKGHFKYHNVTQYKTADQKFTVTALTANGLYFVDVFNSSSIKPFFSAGVGIAHIKPKNFSGFLNPSNLSKTSLLNDSTVSAKSKNSFAYNLGAGVEYRLESVALRLSYKFSNFGKVSTVITTVVDKDSTVSPVKTTRTAKIRAHEVLLGVKVTL